MTLKERVAAAIANEPEENWPEVHPDDQAGWLLCSDAAILVFAEWLREWATYAHEPINKSVMNMIASELEQEAKGEKS